MQNVAMQVEYTIEALESANDELNALMSDVINKSEEVDSEILDRLYSLTDEYKTKVESMLKELNEVAEELAKESNLER
jgi:hypothetical protein